MSKTLILPLKRVYFELIRDGLKPFEYRLRTPHWTKRLVDRHYDEIELTLGYPAKGDHERRLVMPFRGYIQETITHPFFGDSPVDVFSIRVSE